MTDFTDFDSAVGAAKPPPRVPQEVLDGFAMLDCPTVFNAVHQLTPKPFEVKDQWRDQYVLDPGTQYTDATINMHAPLPSHLTAVVGYATTIEVTTNEPDSHEAMTWDAYYTHLQNTPGPHIAVLKDVDTLYPVGRSAVFGDGMATLHSRCGAVGAVCDGAIRDVDGIKKVPFPVWATGEVSGHGRFVIKGFQQPVTVGQLRIHPGDLIMADSGGVIRIPLEIAEKVLERARNIRGKEAKIFAYYKSAEFKAEEMMAKTAELAAEYDKEHPESFAE